MKSSVPRKVKRVRTVMAKIDFIDVDDLHSASMYPYPPYNLFVMGTQELKFKLAACSLVFRGIYPSGRQILKELGSDRVKDRRVNLNGRECQWKSDIFGIFKIKPYFGYAKRGYQPYWEETLKDMEFDYERGPHGRLRRVVKDENTNL